MPSQNERRSTTRNAILSAARDLFGSRSFGRVTIEDVAASAGVTKGGLYHHFDSKDALFAAILEAEQRRLADMMISADGGDVVDRLAEAVRTYLVAASAPVARQILLIDGPAVLGWARWREIDQRIFGDMMRQTIRIIRGGDSGEIEIEALSNLIIGAVTEAAMVCASSPTPEKSAIEAAAALRVVMAGLNRSDAGGN